MIDFETPGGGRVRVVPAPEYLGKGVLLVLSMVSTEDTRRAEIYLSPDNIQELALGLKDASASLGMETGLGGIDDPA